MIQKSKEIFADSKRLREKLGIYLQTPEKVEIYAQSAETMFEKGGRNGLAFVATWSWWGFFFDIAFCVYRKRYGMALLNFFLAFFGKIVIAISAKYFIIKDFESKLDLDDDEQLKTGTNMGGVVIFVISMLALGVLAGIAEGR